MRTLIHQPMYKVLVTSLERREAFEKYIAERRRYDKVCYSSFLLHFPDIMTIIYL
jgi:hypothetical protein